MTGVTKAMACAICGMVHIKEPLLLIEKSSRSSGGSGFPLSLSEWSFIICTMAYNYKNVVSASLNKTFPPFFVISFVFTRQKLHSVL